MNRNTVVSILCVAPLFMTCQEAKEDLKNPVSEKDIYRTIGEEIPFETGMEWIAYYKKQQSSLGRTELLSSYVISSAQLNEMLSTTTDLVGVAFHYGIDELGSTHILAIPVDETLSLWSSIPGRIFVDANSGEAVSQHVAAAWAQQYKNTNPSGVWFHFFGKDIFDDMRALPFFNSVDIQPATSLLDLTPQLLLVVWDDDLDVLGRSQSSYGTVYDASNACPPCAAR